MFLCLCIWGSALFSCLNIFTLNNSSGWKVFPFFPSRFCYSPSFCFLLHSLICASEISCGVASQQMPYPLVRWVFPLRPACLLYRPPSLWWRTGFVSSQSSLLFLQCFWLYRSMQGHVEERRQVHNVMAPPPSIYGFQFCCFVYSFLATFVMKEM